MRLQARTTGPADPAPPRDLFGALYVPDPDATAVLMRVARDFSPRVTSPAAGEAVLDLAGLTRLFGDPRVMAAELRQTAAASGLQVRVAIAGSRTAVRLLARHRPGLTIVAPGDEAQTLAPLPIDALLALAAPDAEHDPATLVQTLQRWGLRTLGEIVRLPAAEVAARLGQPGVRMQRLARGEDLEPLVPEVEEERFEEAFDLEWPIEGLEPLSFVLGRLLEPLSHQLERRDRGAAALHVHLHLVTRTVHRRSLQLPVPMREPRALRTLLLLDLESHPPAAAIDRIVVSIDPTPGRVVQYSLLTRPLPTPEQLSTLMARLQALMGESRCGAPACVDSWAPGAFTMAPFAPREQAPESGPRASALSQGSGPVAAVRRLRSPLVARVQVEAGRPVRVIVDRRGFAGGRVEACAGPWRTSGGWWTARDASRRTDPASRTTDPASRTTDPASRTTDPTSRRTDPTSRRTDPTSRTTDPASRTTDPASRRTDPTSRRTDPTSRRTDLQVGSSCDARLPATGLQAGASPGAWDRDEWDVLIAGGTIYRLCRDRERGTWFVAGMVD